MAEFEMDQARVDLDNLVNRAIAGERISIVSGDGLSVRLVPEPSSSALMAARGAWKGKVKISDSFDEFPDELARDFGLD